MRVGSRWSRDGGPEVAGHVTASYLQEQGTGKSRRLLGWRVRCSSHCLPLAAVLPLHLVSSYPDRLGNCKGSFKLVQL